MTQFLRMEEYIKTGGVIMAPLALISLAMWWLIVNRALFFRRLHRNNMTAGDAWSHISQNLMPDTGRHQGIVAVLVIRFLKRRGTDHRLDRFILDEALLSINRSLNDHLAVIGVLAGIAPLLGLLGTVTGMISTFDILSIFGTGNAKGMAGGISEALITTQTGLLVAIPGLYMKGFLDRRARNLKQNLTQAGYYIRRQLSC